MGTCCALGLEMQGPSQNSKMGFVPFLRSLKPGITILASVTGFVVSVLKGLLIKLSRKMPLVEVSIQHN